MRTPVRRVLNLGHTPLMRRLFAALILLCAAVGTALWRSGGSLSFDLFANLVAALAALAFLHFRWRRKERRALTPSKVKDIFS